MEETKTMENRVARHSSEEANRLIRRETDENVKFYARHPELIPGRLQELEEEWDIERTLETNAASLSLLGIALSLIFDKKFLLLPGLVAAFLLQHGLQGWCPPLPLFRSRGIRTKEEILRERNLLKAVRGDYDHLCNDQDASPEAKVNLAFRSFNE
ncbi:MAG: hypothetical protein ACLFUB_01725 [Cyclobacteriaceae bacterium]